MYYLLSPNDIIFTPLYIAITSLLLIFISRYVKPLHHRKYFFYGIYTKIFSAIIFGLIYEFKYNGGDTSAYYLHGKIIGQAFYTEPTTWLKLIFTSIRDIDTAPYLDRIVWHHDASAYFPSRIAGFLSPFCFETYSIISIYYSIICFSGLWAMYTVLTKLFPPLYKAFAFSIFFTPSLLFWGSGIMKDGLSLSALGWLFYGIYNLFILRKKKSRNIIIILISGYVIILVKIYIILCFLPAVGIWILYHYNYKIKSNSMRNFLKPIMVFTGISFGIIITNYVSKYNEYYQLSNLDKVSKTTRDWITTASQMSNGSAYDIGTIDYTLTGMIQIFPLAVNVSLFRPYLWESTNVFILLSAIESSIILYLTLQVLFFKPGFRKIFSKINETPILIILIIFSISFAFAIGISTNNFGALVRYKIPLMPFYLSALIILKSKYKTTELND